MTIQRQAKPTFLYYFGDYDPSGVDITRAVEEGIREFAPDEDITFKRIALTREQIGQMKLPSRPTKTSDSRSKNFEGKSVEVDAIPPSELRRIAEECITQHIDRDAYDRLKAAESTDKWMLREIFREAINDV
jgi:hypothetical protein